MSDQPSDQPSDRPAPLSRAQLEAAIDQRRRHLADTLDELGRRLEPSRLAGAVADDARDSARSVVVAPGGGLRVERVVAIVAAVVVVIAVSVIARARTRGNT